MWVVFEGSDRRFNDLDRAGMSFDAFATAA